MNIRLPRMIGPLALIAALTGCDSADDEPKAQAPKAGAAAAGESGHSDGDRAESGVHAGDAAPDVRSGAEADHAEHAERLTLSAEEAVKAGVEVAALELRSVPATLELTATISANQDRLAHISPRVSGKLVQVMANLGDRVHAGETLALVDSIEIGTANAEYLQALSAAELARANLERAEKLNAEQIMAQKDYLAARNEAQQADAALRAAQDKLRLLGASSPQPESQAQSIYALRAPFAGTVIEKHAILGELATPEKTLFAVADLSLVWIEANLFEKDLPRVKRGAQARVLVTAYPGESFPGRLTYISDTVDRETRTVQARVEVANRDGRLKPGMFATANLQTAELTEALTVPQSAVVLLEGKLVVFVQEGNAYEARNVQPGFQAGGQVQIVDGIHRGERIVVDGAYELKARLLKSQMGEGHVH